MAAGEKRRGGAGGQPSAVPAPPSHRILTGDALGLLKVTDVPAGNNWDDAACKHRWGQPDKERAIQRLQVHCSDWDSGECLVLAARAGGRVEVCSGGPDGGQLLSSFRLGSGGTAGTTTSGGRGAAPDAAERDVRAMHVRPAAAAAAGCEGGPLTVFCASASGNVTLHSSGGGAAAPGGSGFRAGACGSSSSVVQSWEEAASFRTIGNLLAMDASASGRSVAVGGDGHQLSVWDVAAGGQQLFKGKAGKASRSGLQDLAHVTAVTFLPGGDEQQVLVGTSKHKLWRYDMRAGKKPQSEVQWSEGRLTTFAAQPDGLRCWVGNGLGQIEALDLRQFKVGHALKGTAGSVTALALHPSQPLIASVGLDRHLRVHNTAKRTLLARVYLKQHLSGVGWLPPVPAQKPLQEQEEEEEPQQAEEEVGQQLAMDAHGWAAAGVDGDGDDDFAGSREEALPAVPAVRGPSNKKKKHGSGKGKRIKA